MKRITRIAAACLAAILLLVFSACTGSGKADPAANGGYGPAQGSPLGMVNGSLESGSFKLFGISMTGNQAGWEEDPPELVRNEKPCAVEGVRAIFELNEWIEFAIEYEYAGENGKAEVMIVPHSESANGDDLRAAVYYASFDLPTESSFLMNDGFYLDPDKASPGVYDMIIAADGETVGVLELHFFAEGELVDKTAQQLEALLAVG